MIDTRAMSQLLLRLLDDESMQRVGCAIELVPSTLPPHAVDVLDRRTSRGAVPRPRQAQREVVVFVALPFAQRNPLALASQALVKVVRVPSSRLLSRIDSAAADVLRSARARLVFGTNALDRVARP